MGLYSRYVLPAIITCACGQEMMAEQRRRIVPRARGVVLELGAGAGANFPFYDASKVSKVYALEPEPGMLVRARKAAARAPLPVEILPEKAEDTSLPPHSADSVVVTFSLCTIPDVPTALSAAKRVLRPGGQLFFCEHGRAEDPPVIATQERLEPVWKRLFGGCHLTRDIPALVRGAGFTISDLEKGYAPHSPALTRFAGFLYCGAAAPAG